MDTYSLIALIFVALILILALVVVRRYNRKQQKEEFDRAIEKGDLEQIELVRVQNPSKQDTQVFHSKHRSLPEEFGRCPLISSKK